MYGTLVLLNLNKYFYQGVLNSVLGIFKVIWWDITYEKWNIMKRALGNVEGFETDRFMTVLQQNYVTAFDLWCLFIRGYQRKI